MTLAEPRRAQSDAPYPKRVSGRAGSPLHAASAFEREIWSLF
jgi:hypothetical protein